MSSERGELYVMLVVTLIHWMEFFDKKRAHAGHFSKCLQSCEEKSVRWKKQTCPYITEHGCWKCERVRAWTSQKTAVESAKGDVPEHHRKRLLKVRKGTCLNITENGCWKQQEDRKTRRILGQQRKHEAKGISFITPILKIFPKL
jgi:hypothetical protein